MRLIAEPDVFVPWGPQTLSFHQQRYQRGQEKWSHRQQAPDSQQVPGHMEASPPAKPSCPSHCWKGKPSGLITHGHPHTCPPGHRTSLSDHVYNCVCERETERQRDDCCNAKPTSTTTDHLPPIQCSARVWRTLSISEAQPHLGTLITQKP